MSSPGLTLSSPGLSGPGQVLSELGPTSQSLAQAFQMIADRQMDGQTDGRTDFPSVLQDFVPFGSAALLTSKADS